jgi:hypothetical protein
VPLRGTSHRVLYRPSILSDGSIKVAAKPPPAFLEQRRETELCDAADSDKLTRGTRKRETRGAALFSPPLRLACSCAWPRAPRARSRGDRRDVARQRAQRAAAAARVALRRRWLAHRFRHRGRPERHGDRDERPSGAPRAASERTRVVHVARSHMLTPVRHLQQRTPPPDAIAELARPGHTSLLAAVLAAVDKAGFNVVPMPARSNNFDWDNFRVYDWPFESVVYSTEPDKPDAVRRRAASGHHTRRACCSCTRALATDAFEPLLCARQHLECLHFFNQV